MPEADPGRVGEDAKRVSFLTFRMGERLYAVSAEQVSKVIRSPPVARLPHGPKSLLGVANLRGSILPIASLRGLLGQEPMVDEPRAIVMRGKAPVALAVDRVDALVMVDEARIETLQAELASDPGERLTGAFLTQAGGETAKILDVRGLLEAAFVQRERPARAVRSEAMAGREAEVAAAADQGRKLVTFEVGGQTFAFDLHSVREILPLDANLAEVPHSESLVLGVMAYRDTVLPLLSLRGLLGFPVRDAVEGREKVVVVAVAGVVVGLVADRMQAIVSADPADVDPTPPMLAARTGGETQVRAIYRADGGRRLISVLTTDRLFKEDVMARLGSAEGVGSPEPALASAGGADLQFVVFRLGDDEFALPIEAVDEVARVPAQVTRLPKTPRFLEGVINLRGEVLPVIDQRRRFDMPPAADLEARRLIVVRTGQWRAGLIVDSVSEVLRRPADDVEPAPDLAGEPTRLVHGVLNLEATGRLILLLDPAELLSRAERRRLDKLAGGVEQAGG